MSDIKRQNTTDQCMGDDSHEKPVVAMGCAPTGSGAVQCEWGT